LKKAMILSAVAGAMLFVLAGASVAVAASPTRSAGAGAATIETQAPAQTFAGDSAEAPWEVAPPRVPGAGFTRAAPPAPNRFVVLSLALLGIAAIGAAAAFTGFSLASRV
jgi:hypothetical protein